jgi:hypothetical protein
MIADAAHTAHGISRIAAGLLAGALLLSVACRNAPSDKPPAPPPVVDLVAQEHVKVLPETRQLLFGAGDRRFLLDGWSIDERDPNSEETFVWATSSEASVSFVVLDVVDEQFLVTLSAYPTAEPQTITVFVNGNEVSRFTAPPVLLEYRFVVPARWLARGRNHLTFRHSALGAPSSAPEARRLAAAYHSILIGPQCLPLRGFGTPAQPRVRRPRGKPALVVTGPLSLDRGLRVPEDAILRYHMALLPPGREAAVAIVRIRDGETAHDVAETRQARRLFDREPSRDVEVDLRAWAGKDIDLELEFRPETCRAAVTHVVIENAGVYVDSRERGSS